MRPDASVLPCSSRPFTSCPVLSCPYSALMRPDASVLPCSSRPFTSYPALPCSFRPVLSRSFHVLSHPVLFLLRLDASCPTLSSPAPCSPMDGALLHVVPSARSAVSEARRGADEAVSAVRSGIGSTSSAGGRPEHAKTAPQKKGAVFRRMRPQSRSRRVSP